MLPSVDFNNQLFFKTEEIYNVIANRMLSPKSVSSNLATANTLSKSPLCIRLVLP